MRFDILRGAARTVVAVGADAATDHPGAFMPECHDRALRKPQLAVCAVGMHNAKPHRFRPSVVEPSLAYLGGYPRPLLEQVAELIGARRLGVLLRERHGPSHAIRSDRALYEYVDVMRREHMRNAQPLARVAFDARLQTLRRALGTHTTVSRVQGGRLKARREIHVDGVFREAPECFLRMIVVHELAHLRCREHDKAFYQLCCRMEPDYHRLEFDVRAWLCLLDSGGQNPWQVSS